MSKERPLSPLEKRRLNRSLDIVSRLAGRSILSETNSFIMRQRMRYILVLLGAKQPNRIMVANGLDIVRDMWPCKVRRLRKLVNGRRARQ